jgi:hypothetical protein
VLLSTGGGILSTIAVHLVRLVRSGGPGFVPFLFPGLMPAPEATDVGRMTDVSGNPLRAGPTDTTSGGNALTCDVLVRRSRYGNDEGQVCSRSAEPPGVPVGCSATGSARHDR